MRVRTFLFITALMLCHPKLWPQALTKQFPSAAPRDTAYGGAQPDLATDRVAAAQGLPGSPSLPDAPPIAELVATPPAGVPVKLISDQQEKHGSVYTLTGHVR